VKSPFRRQRTPYNIVLDAIHLYSLGLSLRQVARELEKSARRSHEAVRRWLAKLGKNARRNARKGREAYSCVQRLPPIRLPESLLRRAEELYNSIGEMAKPSLPVLRKPLKAKQALSLLNPKHLTSLFPLSWCAIAEKIGFEKAVEEACAAPVSYYVEETGRVERERAWRPRKARWRRSFLSRLVPRPSLRDLWPLAVNIARITYRLCRWSRRGRVHDPARLLAALLLKYVPAAKSYRQLADTLRREGLSTGLRCEAYLPSTLFEAARNVPLSVLLTAITVLYLQVFMLYAGKLGRAVIVSICCRLNLYKFRLLLNAW